MSVNDLSYIGTILSVLYIDPDNGHVRFRQDLNNSGLGSKNYIIEDVIDFEYIFNFVR